MKAIIGADEYSNADMSTNAKVYLANDPVSDALQADTLTLELLTEPSAVYGDAIELYTRNDEFIAKMYVDSVERVSKHAWRVNAVSAVGLLIKRNHYGGIYTGEAASTVIASIMGSIPYTLAGRVSGEEIRGHLPIASARDNLHDVLQELGASILKDANGDILIDYIDTASIADIPASKIYLNEGGVNVPAKATEIVVVEHSFMQTTLDEQVTLFDNTDTGNVVSGKLIRFDEPMYNLTTLGALTIDESNANYAVVSGLGELTGYKYTHTQEEYHLATGATGDELVVSVRENELINSSNSYSLAKRLAGYYAEANTSTLAAAVSDVRSGHHISFINVYGEASDGYVEEADIALGVSVDKTDLTVATDYTPGPFGATYDSVMILDASETWQVPWVLSGQHVRVIVFSGSKGGQAGFDGEAGKTWSQDNYLGDPARGGAGGAGGLGFRLAIEEMDLTNASYIVTIGTGGAGGASNGAEGTDGTDSSFDSISSADGVATTSYYDIIDNVTYGETGDSGEAGGDGGKGVNNGTMDDPIKTGGDVIVGGTTYNGGNSFYTGQAGWFSGGGGGAAGGTNGSDATTDPLWPGFYHTNGGDGASASIVPAHESTYAKGGAGGHGGGGGGLAGGARSGGSYTDGGAIGAAGAGGAGGQGSDGFVLIYYNNSGEIIRTASGALVSFIDGADWPMNDLSVTLMPQQAGTPWPAGGGKNLANVTNGTTVNQNITFVRSGGKATMSGTCGTSNAWCTIASSWTLKAGTYTLSGGGDNNVALSLRTDATPSVEIANTRNGDMTFTLAADAAVLLRVRVLANYVISDSITLSPQIEAGNEATEWAPYANALAISGFTGVDLTHARRQLLNIADASGTAGGVPWTAAGGVVTLNGTATSGSQAARTKIVLPAGNYKVSGGNGLTRIRVGVGPTSPGTLIGQDTGSGLSFSTAEGDTFWISVAFSNGAVLTNAEVKPMLTVEEETDLTWEQYAGSTYSVNWSGVAGTVYGGTYNELTGKLTAKYAYVDLGTIASTFSQVTSSNHSLYQTTTLASLIERPADNDTPTTARCTEFAPYAFSKITAGPSRFGVNTSGTLRFHDPRYVDDLAGFTATLSGVYLCYPLATPVEYQLSTQDIETFYGRNSFWASAGTTSASYRSCFRYSQAVAFPAGETHIDVNVPSVAVGDVVEADGLAGLTASVTAAGTVRLAVGTAPAADTPVTLYYGYGGPA